MPRIILVKHQEKKLQITLPLHRILIRIQLEYLCFCFTSISSTTINCKFLCV
jgi:hypothetical protein